MIAKRVRDFYRRIAEGVWLGGRHYTDNGRVILGHDEFVEKETEYLCRQFENALNRALTSHHPSRAELMYPKPKEEEPRDVE